MKEIRRIPDFKRDITGRKKRNVSLISIIKIWFSNTLNIIGLSFAVLGSVFVFAFFPVQAVFGEKATENDVTAEGKITKVLTSNAEVNGESVYKFVYTYTTSNGEFTGQGYATGEIFDEGDDLIVYYKARKPEVSMVPELRKGEFGSFVGWLVMIFPLIGFIMLFFGTRNTIRTVGVLKVGMLAKGKLLKMEPTNTKIDDQTVYAMTFEFTGKDGKQYQCIAKTHKTYNLQDDDEEQLFYDSNNPENAVLLDTLPGSVKKYLLKQSL